MTTIYPCVHYLPILSVAEAIPHWLMKVLMGLKRQEEMLETLLVANFVSSQRASLLPYHLFLHFLVEKIKKVQQAVESQFL